VQIHEQNNTAVTDCYFKSCSRLHCST